MQHIFRVNSAMVDPDCRYNNNGWGRVQSSLWHFMRLQTQFINLVDVEVPPAIHTL